VTIRLASNRNAPAFDPLIAAFQDRYPKYRVEKVIRDPGDTEAWSWLTRTVRAGGVDVLDLTYYSQELTEANQLLDLSPYIQRSGVDLKPYGDMAPQPDGSGRRLEMPLEHLPRVIAYNREMVERRQVTMPTEGWTWQQFREIAGKLTHQAGNRKVWGIMSDVPELFVYRWLGDKTSAGQMPTDAELQATLSFFKTLIFTDQVMPPVKAADWTRGIYLNSSTDPLYSGATAMQEVDLSAITHPDVADVAGAFGIMPLPGAAGAQPVGYTQVWSVGIAANSEHPDAAWDLVAFMTGPEAAEILAKYGALPAYATPAAAQAWLDGPLAPAGSQVLFATRWIAQPREIVPQAHRPMLQLFNRVLSGEMDVEQAMAAFKQEQGAQDRR
jgi:multiple sugar transport system substrate-binding protein